MRQFFRNAWLDIFEKQKNLELYLILVVTVAIFLADIFGVAAETVTTEILLAALAILIYGLIDSRHYNERIENIIGEQSNQLSKLETRIAQNSQAVVYNLIFVQTDQDSTFSFKQGKFQLMKISQI